ncbi:MAG: hypothetical protein PHP27_07100 [Bacteroidales bacterium]|jgi:hypothetical protein|nr:hypothetical protein [Bacteroidales bacterium]MDY0054063.1 hypothetical protein [Bacteroidales bacterium]
MMKKLILASLLIIISVNLSYSQDSDQRKHRFRMSIAEGKSNFYGYSGLSSFDYHIDNYDAGYTSCEIGLIYNDKSEIDFGLTAIGANFIYGNGIKESTGLSYLNISVKAMFLILEKLYLKPSVGLGLLSTTSQIYLGDNKYEIKRNGYATNMDFALEYKVYKNMFIGFKLGALIGNLKEPKLPTDLELYRSNHLNSILSTNSAITFSVAL